MKSFVKKRLIFVFGILLCLGTFEIETAWGWWGLRYSDRNKLKPLLLKRLEKQNTEYTKALKSQPEGVVLSNLKENCDKTFRQVLYLYNVQWDRSFLFKNRLKKLQSDIANVASFPSQVQEIITKAKINKDLRPLNNNHLTSDQNALIKDLADDLANLHLQKNNSSSASAAAAIGALDSVRSAMPVLSHGYDPKGSCEGSKYSSEEDKKSEEHFFQSARQSARAEGEADNDNYSAEGQNSAASHDDHAVSPHDHIAADDDDLPPSPPAALGSWNAGPARYNK